MNLRLIDTENKTDVKKFIQLPFDLYRKNPYWVPQMRSDTRFILDRSSYPFYQQNSGKNWGNLQQPLQ